MSTFTDIERITYTSVKAGSVQRYVDCIPLPKNLKSKFTKRFYAWSKSSGPEWTVSRLKEFKACLLQSFAHPTKKLVGKPEWFSTTRSGHLRGIFRDLWEIGMVSGDNLKAVLYMVNIYSIYRYASLNFQERKDIAKIIMQSPISDQNPLVSSKQRDFKECLRRLGLWKMVKIELPEPFTYASLPVREAGWRIRSGVNEILDFEILTNHRMLISETLGVVLPRSLLRKKLPVVGKIHLNYDPGLKVRHYASPNVVLQRSLEPLKKALLHALRKLPWDCTFNQQKADDVISRALQSGKTVHSVDMSKATDSFPWNLQKTVLREIINKDPMNSAVLFRDIVEQGRWDFEGFRHQVFWRKGQPLGLGPSFPLFALTHGILLYSLNNYEWDDTWFILGDDVVILDDKLYQEYFSFLRGVKVEISEKKSFSSSHLAQFAGKTYTRTNRFCQPLWNNIERKTLPDVATRWYPRFTQGLIDEDLINFHLSLPPPLGIGRNPEGVPFKKGFLTNSFIEAWIDDKLENEQVPLRSSTRARIRNLSYKHMGKDKNASVRPWYMNELIPFTPRERVPRLQINIVHLLDDTNVVGYPRKRYVRKDKHVDLTGTMRFVKRIHDIACRNRLEG